MVSNLPYNVATPVVMRALETAPTIDHFLVMVQREVGERLAAVPGTKAYGALSVKVAYYAQAEVVGIVPPAVFVPKPNVDERARAAATARRRRRSRSSDPERMFALVRGGFATRRKMLRRALAGELGDRAGSGVPARGHRPSAARRDADAAAMGGARAHRVDAAAAPKSRVDAFAKLTLSLHVTGTRADGYHDLDMLVVPVSEPHDELVIRPRHHDDDRR